MHLLRIYIHLLVKVTKLFKEKEFKNAKAGGTLFSFDFIDSQGTEMQGTRFNKEYEKHYKSIAEGCVYQIHGGLLKFNDKKFYN